MGAIPSHHDETSRRKGEMVGNRVPGLNRPRALPTDGLGMASKSHLTVRPVAKDPTHYHNPAGSQSLGNHRRYTSQLYSALTSPSLSAYDGEGGGGLSEPDEFGGLNGLGTPQTPYSTYSTASNYSTPSSPEVSAIDKLPGKLVIPGKFQRRVVSDYQASYGPARALTPDPEMPLQPLGEETPLSSANCGSSPQLEAEPIPDPRTYDDPKGLEVQLPTERTPELQVAPSEGHLSPPTDSPREIAIETAPGRTSSKFISVGNVVEGSGEEQGRQQSPDIVPPTQVQDHDPIQEVSIPSPIFVPSSPVMDSTDPSPQVSPSISTPSTTTSITGVPPVIVQVERPHELVERVVPSNQPRPDSDDAPTSCKTPTSPVLAFPRPPANLSAVDNPSFQLRTPPESPTHASFISTSTSDLSDSTIDYQSRLNHPDPDHDLFVLPLPKDEELPPRQVIREATAGRSMPQALASPLPTLQSPIDFPFTTAKIVSAGSSDPNTSLNGDESPALDASQAEIVIAQSEIIRPASPTFLVSMPTPSPTATAFRLQMPPPPGEDNQTQGPPTRIRKKLHTNNSVPTSFKDTLSPPPTQQSFSAVVHQKTRTSTYVLPPDRVDSLPSKTSSKPVNVFMTPKKKQSSFTEPLGFASPGSELASLVKSAAILEAQLQRGTDSSGDGGSERVDSARRSRSMSRSEKVRVKSASTPALLSTPVTTPGHIPPVPDLVYDDGSSNSGWSSNRHIPPFLPQFRSRKSAAHEDADRKSLAPSHKSRKSEKSTKEKGDSSIPRARKLSARLRSLASSSTNSLKSLGRPSLSSETSVSFDSPATVSIDLMTPQDTGNSEDGRLGIGIGSPGGRSQTSRGSGSEWSTSPRRRDVVGRASSFADRFLSRAGRTKSGVLDDSQGNVLSHLDSNW